MISTLVSLLVLNIIILVHEYGHFWAAKKAKYLRIEPETSGSCLLKPKKIRIYGF